MYAEIDTTEFNRALKEFARRSRGGMPKVVRYQTRLLLKRIINNTPPGIGTKSDRGGLTPLAQGREATTRDLQRAVRPIKPWRMKLGGRLGKRMQEVVATKDHAAITAIFKNYRPSGFGNATSIPFDKRTSHYRLRDRRGRVQREKPFVTPDWELWDAHNKVIRKHVGRGRGGWAEAYRAVGGKPARWYGKWEKMGTVEDNSKSLAFPYVVTHNLSEWAARGDDDRIIRFAVKSRAKDMMRSINYVVGSSAKSAGFKYRRP